jgi:hypothetical protein
MHGFRHISSLSIKPEKNNLVPARRPDSAGSRTRMSKMNQTFQEQHAAGLARIAAGTDILAARANVNGEVLTVRSDQVGLAMVTLHGAPTPGLAVSAKDEYFAMPAVEFDALPDWQ